MKEKIWDFWAKRYDRLWVQKYSLRPTRELIIKLIEQDYKKDRAIEVLDLGCGPGELIYGLNKAFNNFTITGLDLSREMIQVSKERNPSVNHIQMDAKDLDSLEDKFEIIISTHSIPYYKDLDKLMEDLKNLLEDEGRIYMAFASGNSFYDKLALSFVKLTTGPASYPSDKRFKELIEGSFKAESLNIIKERQFMPRIALYKLEKVIR
nr:class I SAM-dependent methyltransferase [Tissierella sp.]